MMPVVDAGVGLSQNNFSLSDYMRSVKQFHLLRIVAVQQRQSTDANMQELIYFQSQAATRGFGGFPNAIIASADLLNPTAITDLVDVDTLENLRGVEHCLAEYSNDFNLSDWEQSINIVAEKNLCLDLTATTLADVEVVAQMAAYKPELSIVVNINSVADEQNQHPVQRLSQLAKYNNVYLKIFGAKSPTTDTYTVNAAIINKALELVGFERIMFSSGMSQADSTDFTDMFDQLWMQYVEICSSLSARQLDSLFRMNAIRVYDL